MSDPTSGGSTDRPSTDRPGPGKRPPSAKAQRRAELKRMAAEAERARKRRQALLGVLGAFVATGLIVGLIYWLSQPGDSTPSAEGTAAPSVKCAPTAAEPQQVPAGFDEALKTKPKVCGSADTVTSLKATTLIQGNGAVVAKGQTISVNYVGVTLKTGEEFDSSWKRGEPAEFPIGVGNVIQGWDQGLVGVKVGSRVQLDIPGNLAYGDEPNPSRPYGTLRFVVDVLGAK